MPLVPNEDKVEEFRLTIRERMDGNRLDQYLVKRFPDYSRAYLQKLIKRGSVLIDGKPVKASTKIHTDQEIVLMLPKMEAVHLKPEEMPLDIIYEDDHLAVLNKLPGIVIHPARGHLSGTLVNGLLSYFDNLSDATDVYRPGIVHRLDRDTSGALLIAKNNQAHAKLSQQFEDRVIHKEYLALVEGEMKEAEGSVVLPLGIDPKNRERITVQHGGKDAVTNYKVLARYAGFTLVHVFPKTGRTHQIRVHLKSQNHPIVADELYGAAPSLSKAQIMAKAMPGNPAQPDDEQPLISRQALHAWRISFIHPFTHAEMTLMAPLPADYFSTLEVFQSLWPSPQVAEILKGTV